VIYDYAIMNERISINQFTNKFSYRLAFGLIAAFLVWITPFIVINGYVPAYYFFVLIGLYFIHQVNVADNRANFLLPGKVPSRLEFITFLFTCFRFP